MSETPAKRPVVLGVSLIAVGVLFILDRADIFEFSWPLILIAIGAALLSGVIAEKKTEAVFPGILLMLLGIVFLGLEAGWLFGGFTDGWPLIMLAVGLAFFASYFAQPSRGAGPLIPGGIVCGAGALFLLANYRVIRWHGVGEILRWWPVILIIIGLYLVLRKK